MRPDSLVFMSIFVDINTPASNFYTLFDTSNSSTSTQFPYSYEIDYVKVWQLKENCIDKVICNLDPALYQSQLNKSLEIEGEGCSSLINNQNMSFYAQDGMILKEGLEIGANNTILFDTQRCRSTNATLLARPSLYIEPVDSHIPPPDAFLNRFKD